MSYFVCHGGGGRKRKASRARSLGRNKKLVVIGDSGAPPEYGTSYLEEVYRSISANLQTKSTISMSPMPPDSQGGNCSEQRI